MIVTDTPRRETTMTEPLTPKPGDQASPDETFTWTGDDGHESHGTHDSAGATGSAGSTGSSGSAGSAGSAGGATAILDSLRDAVDDLAERATPAVREIGARAAELAAIAADRAAPFAKRAGEVTSDASGRLAEKSRTWASEVRASIDKNETATPPPAGPAATDVPPPASDADHADHAPSDGPTSPG
jgi:hypothetical protein